jgi:hypothetical protein
MRRPHRSRKPCRMGYYLLMTTHYSLLTTHYLPHTTYYLPHTTYYSLLTTHDLLLTTHHSPLTTHYSLLTTHYSLLATRRTCWRRTLEQKAITARSTSRLPQNCKPNSSRSLQIAGDCHLGAQKVLEIVISEPKDCWRLSSQSALSLFSRSLSLLLSISLSLPLSLSLLCVCVCVCVCVCADRAEVTRETHFTKRLVCRRPQGLSWSRHVPGHQATGCLALPGAPPSPAHPSDILCCGVRNIPLPGRL